MASAFMTTWTLQSWGDLVAPSKPVRWHRLPKGEHEWPRSAKLTAKRQLTPRSPWLSITWQKISHCKSLEVTCEIVHNTRMSEENVPEPVPLEEVANRHSVELLAQVAAPS
jgi:hypothetical protein